MKDKLMTKWVLANAKEISAKDFEVCSGISFNEFFKNNKKECLKTWKEYQKTIREIIKKHVKNPSNCVCEKEETLPANSFRISNKEPLRLWWCPVHKNTFIVVKHL